MTSDELRAATDQLLNLHERFAPLFGRTESRGHSTDYVKGLLVSSERKNVEAISLRVCADQPGRKEVLAMQRFLSQASWNHQDVQREIQAVFTEELIPSALRSPIGTVGVIDESGFAKRGTESVGVKRQWCGRLGKKENCQVGVYWIGVTPAGCAMLEHQVYLPQEWAIDSARRNKAHVPEEIAFQTKLEIATTLRRRIAETGHVLFDWVIGDELYGRNHDFLDAMDSDEQHYVMEVPTNTVVWTVDPQSQMRRWVGNGRPRAYPTRRCPGLGSPPKRPAQPGPSHLPEPVCESQSHDARWECHRRRAPFSWHAAQGAARTGDSVARSSEAACRLLRPPTK